MALENTRKNKKTIVSIIKVGERNVSSRSRSWADGGPEDPMY